MTRDEQRAYLQIMFKIMEKTPGGGATIEDLIEAYEEATDRRPSERTVYRYIEKLELFFDPLARGEDLEEGEEEEDMGEELAPPLMGIKREKRGRKTYYLFEGDLQLPSLDLNQALLAVLNLYPQHVHILKESFDSVTRHMLKDIISGISMYSQVIDHLQKNVHVAGPVPADPEKNAKIMLDIFQAIRFKKRICLEYLRTYDGVITRREVEPYGFLSRLNNWYLVGKCLEKGELRLFSLPHIRDLEILDKTRFEIPREFSLKNFYRNSWGVWTQDPPPKTEEVILLADRGAAERFRALKFHPSQKVTELSAGRVEVSFRLGEAGEMVPWLLSWGTKVMVKEPDWLREEVKNALRNIEEEYERMERENS